MLSVDWGVTATIAVGGARGVLSVSDDTAGLKSTTDRGGGTGGTCIGSGIPERCRAGCSLDIDGACFDDRGEDGAVDGRDLIAIADDDERCRECEGRRASDPASDGEASGESGRSASSVELETDWGAISLGKGGVCCDSTSLKALRNASFSS